MSLELRVSTISIYQGMNNQMYSAMNDRHAKCRFDEVRSELAKWLQIYVCTRIRHHTIEVRTEEYQVLPALRRFSLIWKEFVPAGNVTGEA